MQAFLSTAKEGNDPLYHLCYLATHTGMRKSELLGLKWEDLDWERRTIKVQRQLRWVKGGKVEFSTPKTRNGIRTIILGQEALQVLKDHKARQAKEHEIIFISEKARLMRDQQLYMSFKGLIKQAELPEIRFHDLRHTAASLMLNYGIPVIIVSKRLGHARASITMDVYGHLIPSKQEEAATLMDRLMKPKNDSGSTKIAPAD